jgi:periplasmic copper chaperone A
MKYPKLKSVISLLALFFHCPLMARADGPEIAGAWIQAVPPSADATAAFMTIRNTGSHPIILTGGATPIAKETQPMVTIHENKSGTEVMGMNSVDKLEIAAGATIQLKPGGDHLMLMNLLSHPKEGDHVELTIRFDPGNKAVDLKVPVYREAPRPAALSGNDGR